MVKIRLLIIEDNRLLREGIAELLKKHSEIKVVLAFGDGEKIITKVDELKPDIILMDIGLRNHNSLNVVKQIKKDFTEIKIIIMDLSPTQAEALEFIQAGVSGFILKDATINDFVNTIRKVNEGAKVLPGNLTSSLFSQIITHALNGNNKSTLMKAVAMTKREKQVIELVADGFSNKEIASKLNLSTYTVKSHVHNILEKLALRTRVQIANYAHQEELYNQVANSISLINE